MTSPAIIAGTLVDVRNVGTHKSVKLTIHVPEEYATKVVAAFGWPTGVNPVSVAIARLVESQEQQVRSEPPRQPAPLTAGLTAGAAKERRAFSTMTPPAQAGMLGNDLSFQRFLQERYREEWDDSIDDLADGSEDQKIGSNEIAAQCIRKLCNVTSRRFLDGNSTKWTSLILAYRLWQNEPSVVPA